VGGGGWKKIETINKPFVLHGGHDRRLGESYPGGIVILIAKMIWVGKHQKGLHITEGGLGERRVTNKGGEKDRGKKSVNRESVTSGNLLAFHN